MSRIPGLQIEDYMNALLDAFDEPELAMMLRISLDKRLDEYSGGGNLRIKVFELLTAAERGGWDAELLRAAYQNRPANPALIEVYHKYGLDTDIELQLNGQPVAEGPTSVGSQGFESIVRTGIPMVDFGLWLEKLALIENWVCRLEYNDRPLGTGFLAGPDIVLTNFHVLESVINGSASSGNVSCRFGYHNLADGSRDMGQSVGLHTKWNLDHSPYSSNEADGQPQSEPLPTTEELDYCLVRLAEAIGNRPVNRQSTQDAPSRGWLALPEVNEVVPEDAPLLIAQHPEGAPMKLAIDTNACLGMNDNQTRLRYRTNTEAGSSGSPCFDMHWNLVALHHYGDVAYDHPRFNQGIPVSLIRERIIRNVGSDILD